MTFNTQGTMMVSSSCVFSVMTSFNLSNGPSATERSFGWRSVWCFGCAPTIRPMRFWSMPTVACGSILTLATSPTFQSDLTSMPPRSSATHLIFTIHCAFFPSSSAALISASAASFSAISRAAASTNSKAAAVPAGGPLYLTAPGSTKTSAYSCNAAPTWSSGKSVEPLGRSKCHCDASSGASAFLLYVSTNKPSTSCSVLPSHDFGSFIDCFT
mmetsp:Transcript_22741/g.76879  ORF Transcript_22741/g.76879 Transcript_22741/m.76879 type:complete len:214 (+) Transcript_22741:607-1248(+)